MTNQSIELWLVRHGETTASASRRIAGGSNPPLSEHGRREARDLGALLADREFTSVWSSDLDRTVETARLAWGEARVDPRLRELDFGVWEGRSYDAVDPDVRSVFHRFRGFAIEGGDTYADFRQRVLSFVDGLDGGRHLLVVHGGVIRVLTQNLGLDRFVATGSLVVVDWSGGRLLSIHEPSRPPEFSR
jgi:probable phosphoglycerate mutase